MSWIAPPAETGEEQPESFAETWRMHLDHLEIVPDRFPARDSYPFCLPVFQQTRGLSLSTPVTFFCGENGSGKSTLLKAISRACGIYIWAGVERERCTKNPFEEELHRCLDVTWNDRAVPGAFFASDIFRNFTQLLEEWAASDPGLLAYFGGKSLLTQSHGQGHMAFFESRFRRKGLYLLDEPETALSPTSQIRFLRLLKEVSESGLAQFIIATHSPILLSLPGAAIYSFDRMPITRVSYLETAHFRVYQDFFKDFPPR